jgi:signal transduction histidine kinase
MESVAQPRARRGFSIRTHLFAIILALVVGYAAVGGAFVAIDFAKARDVAAGNMAFDARLARDAVTRSLTDVQASVASAAAVPGFALAIANPRGCSLSGGTAGAFAGHFDIVRADGTDVCSSFASGKVPASAGYAGQPWLAAALGATAPIVSAPFDDPVSGERSIAVAAPIRSGGRATGVFADVLQVTGAATALSETYGGPQHATYTLVDVARGVVLSSAETPSVSRPVAGTPFASSAKDGRGLDGIDRIYGAQAIDGTTWRVYAGIRTDVAFAATHASLAHEGIVGAVALLLAFGVLLIVDRRVGAPVRRLRAAIKRSARVINAERVSIGGPSEVRELVASFNAMIETRARYETRLHQSERLESLGRLAAGISHDFNNLLTAIGGYGELIETEIHASSDGDPWLPNTARASVLDDLAQIKHATQKAADLTQRLLEFGRHGLSRAEVVNLNAIVGDMRKLLARALGESVELSVTCAPDLRDVRVDRAQVEQILMNLAVNAGDAMPGGGTLTVATANVHVDDDDDRLELQPGAYVCLTVVDDGAGMEPEVAARAFEPFFTTKSHGRGNGLGLATIHGIVAQAGGTIQLSSEPGIGTTFRIYLPEAGGAPEAASAGLSSVRA